MNVSKLLFAGLAGMMLTAGPLAAQGRLSPNGEVFLKALRENAGGKALSLVESNGASIINHRGIDGSTPLHVVVRTRNAYWLSFLLEKGADMNAGDRNGDTPLILASRTGYGEGVAQLLRSRADVNRANRLGETALIVAVQQRQTAIVSTLLKLGADPDKRDHTGYSAREHATRDTRSREMLKLIETVKSRASQIAPTKP
ncbi:MAG: ankyrin repeat domain-containing protein [Sphingomicrobium sp.]